jgi:hypothetical protein
MHEDLPGRFKEDPARYYAVAEKIMKENGVIINDLYAESIRQGYPKRADVHSTGNLAPQYAQHLPNLIRDLRRDLEAPKLPVVVGGIGWERTFTPLVLEAQLAVGDAAKYREFAGTVASVDTRPLLRPAEVSPSSRKESYRNNAESFLDIGKAMGDAMLHLLKEGGNVDKKLEIAGALPRNFFYFIPPKDNFALTKKA